MGWLGRQFYYWKRYAAVLLQSVEVPIFLWRQEAGHVQIWFLNQTSFLSRWTVFFVRSRLFESLEQATRSPATIIAKDKSGAAKVRHLLAYFNKCSRVRFSWRCFCVIGCLRWSQGKLLPLFVLPKKKKNSSRMLANARNNRSIPLIINGSPKSANFFELNTFSETQGFKGGGVRKGKGLGTFGTLDAVGRLSVSKMLDIVLSARYSSKDHLFLSSPSLFGRWIKLTTNRARRNTTS